MYLSIAKEFSETPGPRSKDEGEFSGEEFLQSLLQVRYEAAKAANENLTIDLDGTEGYATSFLEAAFGGLARIFEPIEVLNVIQLKCDDEPLLVVEVQKYIKEARK